MIRRFPCRVVFIGIGVLVLAGLTSLGVASRLEERDRFCASCHMAPERTYYNRAQFALAGIEPAEDLASAHYAVDATDLPSGTIFRCIDCHRGNESISHRTTTLALGARDAAIYLLGSPDQMIEKTEIEVPHLLTDSCLKCHSDTLLMVGFPNHFHNKLPAAFQLWQASGTLLLPSEDPELYQQALEAGLELIETDLLCVDCHLAHITTPGSELVSYLDVAGVVYPACEECHIAALGDPLGLTNLDEFEEPEEQP